MYFGICQWNLPVKGPSGCYEIAKLGLDGMELEFNEELIEKLPEYQKAAAETGMKFPTIGMNIFCDNSYIEEGSGSFFEEQIKKALMCAEALKVKVLQIPAFGKSDISTEEELKIAARNLKRACELATPYGILIGTENALNAEKNRKLFRLVNHPGLRFYFDNQNLWRMKGLSCREVLETMKNNIVEAHAKDSRIILKKQRWKALGLGDAEYQSSMDFLKANGFDGWIHLENDYQIDAAKKPRMFDWAKAIKKDLSILKNTFAK